MKVLICDDHGIFRKMVRNMIDKSWTVFEAGNGEEGLAHCKANADIGVIFTDYNMPKMNGLQMLEALRGQLPSFHPKIVFISSERDKQLNEKAKALGVTHWLPKPFKKEELDAVMRQAG